MTLIDKILTGLKIRKEREDKGLTQAQLAEMIDMADRTISRIEVGRVNPEFDTMVAIAKVLNVSLDYLISDDTTVSKDVYVHAITERVSRLELKMVKHILGYIEFYNQYNLNNNFFALITTIMYNSY